MMTELEKKQAAARPSGRLRQQNKLTARVLSICRQGQTADSISRTMELSPDTVQEIIAQASQKSRILYVFMDREIPATIIDVCGVTRKVRIINLTDELRTRLLELLEQGRQLGL